ncbi:MAG: tRNA glutamyl-Q(34) synthetase GluQRS [Terrimicrobiaceae bacterium]
MVLDSPVPGPIRIQSSYKFSSPEDSLCESLASRPETVPISQDTYIGRLAPTPTGELHVGHASTFLTAWKRARASKGRLILRIEDLDTARCRPEFTDALIEDLHWLGIDWDGEPVFQSSRRPHYFAAWKSLRDRGFLYPCLRSRRELAALAPMAPHQEEPLFPSEWRGHPADSLRHEKPDGINWRFRVPDGEEVIFEDQRLGAIRRVAGHDFGDFLVWNRDNIPAYELAVVVDDLAMGVTEIVRGEDLITSTARQILISRALGGSYPATYHCPLIRDSAGRRLAKRDGASSLRTLRSQGLAQQDILHLT